MCKSTYSRRDVALVLDRAKYSILKQSRSTTPRPRKYLAMHRTLFNAYARDSLQSHVWCHDVRDGALDKLSLGSSYTDGGLGG